MNELKWIEICVMLYHDYCNANKTTDSDYENNLLSVDYYIDIQ